MATNEPLPIGGTIDTANSLIWERLAKDRETTIAGLHAQIAELERQNCDLLVRATEDAKRAFGDRFKLETKVNELTAAEHSMRSQRDVAVWCLRNLFEATRDVHATLRTAEGQVQWERAMREAGELLAIIDHKPPTSATE